MTRTRIARRTFVAGLPAGMALVLLAACMGQAATPTPTPKVEILPTAPPTPEPTPTIAPTPTAARATATTAPATAAPARLRVGGAAVVDTTPEKDPLNLRREPGRSAPIVRTINHGERLMVVDGPREVAGQTWWKVEYQGLSGWVAGSFIRPVP